MVTVRTLDDKEALHDLVGRQPLQPFLQSWTWGEFQHVLGRPIWWLGAFDENRLVGSALVIGHELLLRKTYLYCPRGPLADRSEVARTLFVAMRSLGEKENAMYVKVDPGIYHFADDVTQLAGKYTLGTTLQPQQTLVIDTAQSPDDLLASMHPKTRYNIRLAEKKKVTVRWSTELQDLETFLGLMHQTAQRQGIRLHQDQYYRQLFTVLQTAGMAELILGEYNGAVRSAHMIIWHGRTATYLHGGSDDSTKEAMVPYLLQWETIKQAHQRGVKEYDLWGIAPDDEPTHKWAGITRFKRGFSGRQIVFPLSLNAILQPQWYQAYRLAKRMRGGVDE
ncbi:MAG: peptidoglycan bridge formation glycyltransferase FemA/FemB family protein [Patescibacteria group bacterium]